MLTKLLLASVVSVMAASVTGCVPCDAEVTQHGLAPRPLYDPQIDACITMHACVPLCREVFALDGSVDVRSCKIELVDAANAHVVVRYDDDACAASDDGSYDDGDYSDDGSYDGGDYGDGTDDGSTDDGSSDDGSTDPGDDGSTDTGNTGDTGDTGDEGDTGGDSGGGDSGGDSGGDDGGWRLGPHERAVKSLTTPDPRQ